MTPSSPQRKWTHGAYFCSLSLESKYLRKNVPYFDPNEVEIEVLGSFATRGTEFKIEHGWKCTLFESFYCFKSNHAICSRDRRRALTIGSCEIFGAVLISY